MSADDGPVEGDSDPAAADCGPTLLVGSSDAALERLAAEGEGPLVVVACGGRSDQLLRRAAETAVPTDVALFDLCSGMRSAAGGAGTGSRDDVSVVTAVPRADLGRVGGLVDDVLADGAGAGSVYVDGEGLVSTVGVGHAFRVFDRLRRRHRPRGTTVYGSLPGSARETTVAGIAPLFDAVAGIEADGELRSLDPPGDEVLPIDRRLDLLKPKRRRDLVRTLDGRDGRVGLEDLASAVASRGDASADELRVLLYQSDLPKLDDHGVVDFDRGERTATLSPAAIQLWPVLEVTDRPPAPRPTRL